jgi:carbon storage regulator CsrA
MLVLSRKEGERLVIGDNITIVVSKVNGNRVTIGIEAPSDVRIVRGELEGKQPAAATSAPTPSVIREALRPYLAAVRSA